MSKFSDILKNPLPSKMTSVTESVDGEEIDTTADEACAGAETEDVLDDAEDITSDALEDDDIDADELSEEELAALDAELSDEALGAVVDDEEEVKLTPEEEIEADDMMSISATTLLVNDELNAEEKVQFLESDTETTIAVNEGFMTANDVNTMATEAGLVTEANYNKKMIIRLDAASKQKQLYALAVNVTAAAHHDPDFIKLKKVMKMRKILRTKLERKYHGEAQKRMKIYFARLRNSKSKTLSKIGNKVDK